MAIALGDHAGHLRLAEQLPQRLGALDVLVNSAGYTQRIPHDDLARMDPALFNEVLTANVGGPYSITRALLPLLRRSGAATVVNVSSVSAFTGLGSNIAYCAAKAALDTLGMSLARALGPEVRVLSVSPAAVDTGFVEGRSAEEVLKKAQQTPLGRVVTPEDVAQAVLACVTHLKTATGSRIVIDGAQPVMALNATHDPALRSWVTTANPAETDFPVQNLPFGVFRVRGQTGIGRCCVAIGDQVVDLSRLAARLTGLARETADACQAPVLNTLMACDPRAVSALRAQLSAWLSDASDPTARHAVQEALLPMAEVELLLPWRVGGYTDFFASIHHASNAGRLFRPDQPLLPNYKHVPIAYNGRANSVRVSGVPVTRPCGQSRPTMPSAPPHFGPSQRLDHEVELGLVIGRGSRSGEPVPIGQAWDHVFGFCLLNDWSARDIQAWEYQPGAFPGQELCHQRFTLDRDR
ncbi:3-oxoacyl-[acyl-carrier-protein] reductase FabG [Hydrogenophaga sp. T4]|nr:3-oxoacyl-[acyl-carrier-protein] reductase FabG [Hydrogenophaga sp. T4]